MKQLLTLLALAASSGTAIAQCDSPVPASATVIDTDGVYSIVGAQWVCGSVTATLGSAFVNAFIEGNANVTANTNLGVYSVRTGSTLTISGFNNNIYYDPTATIVDNGTNTMLTVCPDLTFDYTNAPANGCDLSMHVGSLKLPTITVFPNPTNGILTITGGQNLALGVRLIDPSGKVVLDQRPAQANGSSSIEMDLGSNAPGIYMLQVTTLGAVLTQRISILE
ncbi:MAG: T9SS type A sorting domain-containing protein [Flavobacteriales bacterium]